jgi:hypothetical protein
MDDESQKRFLAVLVLGGLAVFIGVVVTSGNRRPTPSGTVSNADEAADEGVWTTKYDGQLWIRNKGHYERDQNVGGPPDNPGYGSVWTPAKQAEPVVKFMWNETLFKEHGTNWTLRCSGVKKPPPDHYSFRDVLGDLQRERRSECEIYHGRIWTKNTESDHPIRVHTYVTVDREGVFNVKVEEWRTSTSWLDEPDAKTVPKAGTQSEPVAAAQTKVEATEPDPIQYEPRLGDDRARGRGVTLSLARKYVRGPAGDDMNGKTGFIASAETFRIRGRGESGYGSSTEVVLLGSPQAILPKPEAIRRTLNNLEPWSGVAWHWKYMNEKQRRVEVIRYEKKWRLRIYDWFQSDEWTTWMAGQNVRHELYDEPGWPQKGAVSPDGDGPLLGDERPVAVDMAWPLWKTQSEFDAECESRGGDLFGVVNGWGICRVSDGGTRVETANEAGNATGFRRTWFQPDGRLDSQLEFFSGRIGTNPVSYVRQAGGDGAATCEGVRRKTWYSLSRASAYAAEATTTAESCVFNGNRTTNFRVEIGDGKKDWPYADRY